MKFKFINSDKVVFEAKGHTYTGKTGKRYTSVTTLLKEYYPPFDAEYWSDYKAIKDILSNAGIWRRYKEAACGWDKVVAYYRTNYKNLDDLLNTQIRARKNEYLQMWKQEGEEAAALGTKQHNALENLVLSHKKIDLGEGNIADVSATDILELQNFNSGTSGVYTELLLWNERYGIAGQADRVERVGKYIKVKDYKTFKKVEFEAFMDQKMYEPIHELPNTNYSKTTMQLSIYAWMLEVLGYTVEALSMIHIDRVTGNFIEEYPMAYRRDLVIKMLEDYDGKRA